MTDIDKTVQDTAQYEGYKPSAYKDSRGLWTLGEGTCLETNPISGKDWKALLDAGLITVSVTGAGARWLLRAKVAGELRDLATRYQGFAALPDLAQTLLLEIAYQLGVDGVLEFVTFNNLIRSGQYAAAAADGRKTRWYSQTPARAESILKQLEGLQT